MNPTLSLCMITYHADASDLNRCLESVTKIPGLLDEIIIVDTSSEPSEEIKAVSDTYGAKLYHRAFQDDFSDVRNYSFDMASSSHVLWLDSDDQISEDNLKRLIALKPDLDKYDVWIMNYNYAHDQNGNPALVLPRERIVKKCPEIRWTEPVHECLTIQESTMIRVDVAIDHNRTHQGSPERNIRILKKQYDNKSLSCRGMFYYAKELFDSGSMEEAVRIFEEYQKEAPGKDFVDNIAISFHKCAQYYGEQSKYPQAKILALRSLQYSSNYAETYVLLGDLYQLENNSEAAIEYYTQALSKSIGTAGMSQLPQFYHYLPNRALALLYQKQGNIEKAQYHAKAAIAQQPDDLMQQIVREVPSPKVAWLFPGKADPSNGSQRIRRINLHMCLNDSKILEHYLQKPYYELINELEDRNVVIFQHFCLPDLRLIQYLKSQGKRTIMDDCEAISGYPYQTECMQAVDAVTCCSETLAQIRASQGVQRVAIIPDAWEPTQGEPDYSRTKLKAGFFGMGGNSFMVTSWLRSTIEAAGYELVVCTEWDDATVKWHPDTWASEMYACDVILCPQRVDVQPAKSNVKITQAMSMGLPVIASPLPAYTKIISHGENGYIASTPEEWGQALAALSDPETRRRVGLAGRASIGPYSIDSVRDIYLTMCRDILCMDSYPTIEPQKAQEPVQQQQSESIDLIIPLYNNFEYLRLCLDSILLNTTPDTPYRIIISDAGSTEETWIKLRALKGMVLLGSPTTRLNFSEACNQGILNSSSKFFVILNSDVIVSKGWLTGMQKNMLTKNRLSSCGVLSNCDSGWTINALGKPTIDLKVNNQLILHPGMKLEEVIPYMSDLDKYMSLSNQTHKDQFVEQDWVAGYCTMYARSAIDEVGLFDPYYNNGCEDLDIEKRLRAQGYKAGQAYDSFVLHFGGVTRYNLQSENREQYDKDDRLNHEYYHRKWAKKRIVIYTGPAWEPWTFFTVQQGMAGSETWAAYIAEELAKLNFDVTIYGQLDSPTSQMCTNGVTYADHRRMLEDLKYVYVDIFISSRNIDIVAERIHAIKTYVMIHDIWLHPDPNHDMQSWRVNKYFYLSQWHKEFLKQHHMSIPDDKLYKTNNGIPFEYYSDHHMYTKFNMSVYSSSPDRGLLQLLEIMPDIRKAVPDFKLIVCYGFHNWESAAKLRNDHVSLKLIERIKSLMEQPGVIYKGRVNKQDLATYQMGSKVWLMPEWFTETFSITAIENKAAKNAIVTTDLGGLKDTVGEAGILLPPDGLSRDEPLPESYKDKFLEESIRLLTDEEYRLSWVNKTTPKSLEKYQWSEIAKEFLK